jgi:hypothetical protein
LFIAAITECELSNIEDRTCSMYCLLVPHNICLFGHHNAPNQRLSDSAERQNCPVVQWLLQHLQSYNNARRHAPVTSVIDAQAVHICCPYLSCHHESHLSYSFKQCTQFLLLSTIWEVAHAHHKFSTCTACHQILLRQQIKMSPSSKQWRQWVLNLLLRSALLNWYRDQKQSIVGKSRCCLLRTSTICATGRNEKVLHTRKCQIVSPHHCLKKYSETTDSPVSTYATSFTSKGSNFLRSFP